MGEASESGAISIRVIARPCFLGGFGAGFQNRNWFRIAATTLAPGGLPDGTQTGGIQSLLLQHVIWHEGYHHGQIKMALKAGGRPFEDKEIGPLTWGIWISKTKSRS